MASPRYPKAQRIEVAPIGARPPFALDTVAQLAYWTGRLSSSLEAMLDPMPGDSDVARSCLAEFVEWRDSLVPT